MPYQIQTQQEANKHLNLFFKCGGCKQRKSIKNLEGIAKITKSQKIILICENCFWFGGQNNKNSQWIDTTHHIKPKSEWIEIIRSCSMMEGWLYTGSLFGFCVDKNNKIITNSGIEHIMQIQRKNKQVFVILEELTL